MVTLIWITVKLLSVFSPGSALRIVSPNPNLLAAKNVIYYIYISKTNARDKLLYINIFVYHPPPPAETLQMTYTQLKKNHSVCLCLDPDPNGM